MREKLNTYMHYVAEPSSDEIFLMRNFKTQIIFNAKISQSTVVSPLACLLYT